MTTLRPWFLGLLIVLGVATTVAAEPTGKIVKVLPHLLDAQGRHTVSPSLFDRDAYQFHLRTHRDLVSGARFDIQWKARRVRAANLKMRLELLTTTSTKDRPLVFEQSIAARSGMGRWVKIPVVGEDYEKAGELIAWRVSLWNGDALLSEQKSFLW
ncbi:MAG: hypothetical protein IPM17_11375 [Verrucomicrobia bacterium]|jgi:hypothetical protein|nr:hypothetical protein [Verrucomicrobiota bacterium]